MHFYTYIEDLCWNRGWFCCKNLGFYFEL